MSATATGTIMQEISEKESDAEVKAAKTASVTVNTKLKIKKLTCEELEAASELILSALPDYASESLIDMAKVQLDIPLWQYIAGILFFTYNEGRLGVYDLDPAWAEEGFGEVCSHCVICGDSFTSKVMGQKVCGQKCGIVKAEREIEANKIKGLGKKKWSPRKFMK